MEGIKLTIGRRSFKGIIIAIIKNYIRAKGGIDFRIFNTTRLTGILKLRVSTFRQVKQLTKTRAVVNRATVIRIPPMVEDSMPASVRQ